MRHYLSFPVILGDYQVLAIFAGSGHPLTDPEDTISILLAIHLLLTHVFSLNTAESVALRSFGSIELKNLLREATFSL